MALLPTPPGTTAPPGSSTSTPATIGKQGLAAARQALQQAAARQAA